MTTPLDEKHKLLGIPMLLQFSPIQDQEPPTYGGVVGLAMEDEDRLEVIRQIVSAILQPGTALVYVL
jgi:hypothetical protein